MGFKGGEKLNILKYIEDILVKKIETRKLNLEILNKKLNDIDKKTGDKYLKVGYEIALDDIENKIKYYYKEVNKTKVLYVINNMREKLNL